MRRSEWRFTYTSRQLSTAAIGKRDHHQARKEWWVVQKQKVMDEVKESGIEVSESPANQYANSTKAGYGPQVQVRNDLQVKLTECHQKILEHDAKINEYEGWRQVLCAHAESNNPAPLELNADDYLYFFGK